MAVTVHPQPAVQSALASLMPIASRYGVVLPLDDFQAAVAQVCQECEAAYFDQLHQDMWQSLPRQFELLAPDVLALLRTGTVRMLEVGCRTGLGSSLMLQTPVGLRVTHLHLVDPSAEMLERATSRLAGRGIEVESTQGYINHLPLSGVFDVILLHSVLHRAADLPMFLAEVKRLQRPGGVVVHMHDTSAGAAHDPALAARKSRLAAHKERLPGFVRNFHPRKVARTAWGRLFANAASYLDQVNALLIGRGIIRMPMSETDLRRVAGVYAGTGLRWAELKRLMPGYDLVASRSYGFFGALASTLPLAFQTQENELSAKKEQSGLYMAGVWQLASS